MSASSVPARAALPKLAPRSLFLIVLAACALLLIAWYFGRFQPRKNEVVQLQGDLDLLRTQAETYRAAQRGLPALRKTVAGLQVESEQFLRALPPTTQFGDVLDEMRQDVYASGAEMTAYTTQAAQISGLPAGVRPLSVNLGITGQFAEVFRALRSIETMNRFTTVSGLSLTLPKATSFNPQLTSTLNLTVYTFDPTQAGATPGTAPAAPGAAPGAAPAPAAAPQGGNQ
ncbi:type 4a pilus biogenesis protein PilO [Deinococcus hopiensis]|uniref:Type IV pilus assembly protein PilO n=1 Tax=Deinococcus hopiensis KR-140 TaxID=695939 RepID=A0A1W1VNM1_9DEIO|nr:type 4a pilus biogenesis protein PilO [Deinococcus hopiensis]SMB94928.1 type IV pilus assembly protein PilO [Deinococcus hopiensis KR-140]